MVGATGTVIMDQGLYPIAGTSTAAVPARQMWDGTTNYLAYFIYSDSANLNPWNDGSTNPQTYVGSGSNVFLTVYGAIPPGQNLAAPGSYQDTVGVTVNF
jgi:spore coat protein U-like protein